MLRFQYNYLTTLDLKLCKYTATLRRACLHFAGHSKTVKLCALSIIYNWTGCKQTSFAGFSAEVCVCNTPRCNMAAMTSSFSHVIIVIAIIISVITVRMM